MMVKMRSSEGQSSNEYEVYLAGNVEIRQKDGKNERNLKAKEVLARPVGRVAVAMDGSMEFRDPRVPDRFNHASRNSPIVARLFKEKMLPSSAAVALGSKSDH